MKILIFNTFYYPKFVGGAEVSVKILAEGLVKAGHEVYVVTSDYTESKENVNGVYVIRIRQRNLFLSSDGRNKAKPLKILWHIIDACNPFNYLTYSRILSEVKPDVVHTNNISGFSPFLWFVIKSKNIPLAHTFRDYYLLCHSCALYHNDKKCDTLCTGCKMTFSIKKNFARYPDMYIGISDFILEKHQEYIPMKNQLKNVVYNAVNTVQQTAIKSLGEKVIFGFIGRLSKEKGIEYLIKELANVSPDYRSQFKLLLAGTGEDYYIDELKRYAGDMDYELLGVVSPADFYNSIDISFVPSLWYEPFGRVVIESLSFNVPVALSDIGGMKEIYDKRSMWTFKPVDGALSILVEQILSNKVEIISKKENCKDQANLFTEQKNVENYLLSYSRLIQEKSVVVSS